MIVIGAPIWLSLLIGIIAVALSLYVSLWAVIIALWAVFASVGVYSVFSIFSAVTLAFSENILTAIALTGFGLISIGLSILLFFGCKITTKCTLILTKKAMIFVKNIFTEKEVAK